MRIIIKTFILFIASFVSTYFVSAQAYELQIETDGTQWKIFEKYGYLGVEDANGKIIIPAQFTYVNYENGTFTVKDNSKHIGKYTRNGKVIFPPIKYSNVFQIDGCEESPFIVIGEHWGVVDQKGKVLLDDVYSNIRPYGDNKNGYHYLLWKDGYMGVADVKGKILIAPDKYFEIGENIGDDGKVRFMCVQYDGGSSVYDNKGELLVHTDFFLTVPKGKGKDAYYEISDGNASGKMDLNGNIIEPIFDKKTAMLKQVESDSKTYSIWRDQNNKYFVKDSDGNIIVDPIYDRIGFHNNHFVVGKGRYTGLINNRGKIIVPPDKYFTVAVLEKYVVATTSDDKQAIFSLDGDEIFPAIHKKVALDVKKIYEGKDSIVSFRDAIGCWGVKDLSGNILVEPIYDDLNYIESDLGFYFLVFKNGKVGLQDLSGNLILEPEYIGIELHSDKEFPFFYINTGYMGIADLDGNIIINPEIFEEISYNSQKQQFTGIIGKRKCVFSNNGKLLSDNKRQIQAEEFTDLADTAFEKKNFKKAAELYGEAIALSPCASLYFNRGVSYYNAYKYIEAINDFYQTLNSNPSDRLRKRSLDLIAKAEHYQEQKEYNQGQLASAIFGLAMTGVNYAVQSKPKGKYSRINNTSTRISSSSSYHNSEDIQNSSVTKQKHKCGICGGKGSTVEYAPTYGIADEKWCDDCAKKVVNGHYHKTCTYCHGTGER